MFTIQRAEASTATLSAPDDALWRRTQSLKVGLVPAPVAMQPSQYVQSKWHDGQFGQLRSLGFQALHNGTVVALRLEWRTESPPRRIPVDNDHFPDAAALLFPMHPDAPIFMGAAGAPVCIWHWKANATKTATVNTAEGIGTSRVVPASNVVAHSEWSDGHWRVVFCRSLVPAPAVAAQPRFAPNDVIRTGFAVWDGSRQERAGLKAFSPIWTTCRLAP